jgi:L-rhamnose mutarotase
MHGLVPFVYLEADNISEAMKMLKSTNVKTRWGECTQEVLEPDVTAMEEVFYME